MINFFKNISNFYDISGFYEIILFTIFQRKENFNLRAFSLKFLKFFY